MERESVPERHRQQARGVVVNGRPCLRGIFWRQGDQVSAVCFVVVGAIGELHMKSLIPALTIVLLSACASAPPSEPTDKPPVINSTSVAQTPDQLFPKILKFLSLNGVTADTIDKQNGVVMASGTIAPVGWVECSKVKGRRIDQKFKLAISLDVVEGSTNVTVALNGNLNGLRRHHILFIPTSSVKDPGVCTTTGAMENALFTYITQ
jgi:hypothetical protein